MKKPSKPNHQFPKTIVVNHVEDESDKTESWFQVTAEASFVADDFAHDELVAHYELIRVSRVKKNATTIAI